MIGENLLHYRITEKIGEGGMGAVYKAVDTHLDRPVAIKILPPSRVADPERKQRFVLEAKAASALRHPNIVVIHDVAAAGSRDFIVMEFVEGQSLDRLIGRRGLELSEALGYAVQIVDGLSKAHAAGIVHRDVKPANIMVTGEGLVKILDFGVAKLAEVAPGVPEGPTVTMDYGDQPRTEKGYILGTAGYMSPEQAEGKMVDARSDIFSLGALLYEMLTGSKAFDRGSQIKTLSAVLTEEPEPLSKVNESIPLELERILARCLRKDPQRRWQTMSDLKVALQDLKEDTESGRLTAASAKMRPKKRKTIILSAAVSVFILAAAALILKSVLLKTRKSVEYEILPLTFDSGMTGMPTVSLDGNLMAYASDREGDGNTDIWVQQISGGRPLRLTTHPAVDSFPSFSPDGSQIAFSSDRDGGGIYLIDALGGEPRKITDGGALPRFSPDGRFISYIVIPPSLESRLLKMFLIPPQGGEPRPFLQDFSFYFVGQGASMVWSPDGRSLLFCGRRIDDPNSRDWWVAPVDGGAPVRTHAVENLGLETIVQYPVGWSGDYVYYVSGTTIEGINLFRTRIDPKDLLIKGAAEAITTGPGMKVYPSVMQDGRILFSNMTASISTWSVSGKTDEGTVSQDPEKLTQDLMQKFSPSISRDGTKAAFIAFGGAQTAKIEVRVKDLRSGRETAIPMREVSLDNLPRLSADGSILAYRDSVSGKRRTYIQASGASAGREICESCLLLDFFPGNDSALLFLPPGELWKMNLETGEKTTILKPRGERILDAKLAPDGKWLAWTAGKPDGKVALKIAPLGESPEEARHDVALIEADYFLASPGWSPDGRWLYYLSEKNGPCAIMARQLDPRTKKPFGEEREVYASTKGRFMMNFPKGNGEIAVAVDRIIFSVTEASGNIYVARPKSR